MARADLPQLVRGMRDQTLAVAVAVMAAMGLCVPAAAQSTAAQEPQEQHDHFHAFEADKAGPPLTLQSALSEALANNPALAALRSQFEVVRQRPAQHRSLMAPTFEAQIWQWPINTFNPANTNMYMFGIGQDLPGRGKRDLRVKLADKDTEIANNEIAVRARDILADVKRTYADLFLARKDIEIHLQSVDLLRQLTDITHAKYSTGRISQQDVVKAAVELSTMHDDLVMMDERARLAEAQLNTLLNRLPDAPVGPLAEPRVDVTVPSSAELQRLALDNQPELRDARLRRERAEAAQEVVRSDYKPDFVVGATYMLMPQDHDAWGASFGLTWPRAPWARHGVDARLAEATADIEAARAAERVVENGLRLAVQEAYIRLQAASQRASLLRTSVVPQSEQAIDVARAAYQTDRGDFLALIDNERALLDARHKYYLALSAVEQARADLERAVGTDLDQAREAQ